MTLSELQGRPVMVNFWATWCPPCRVEMPWIQSVYDEHKDKGFEVLAVDAGERVPPSMVADTVSQFTNMMGLTFPVLMGDNTYQVQRDWSVYGLPATFLLDEEGKVADVHTGMYPNEVTLKSRLEAIVPGAAAGIPMPAGLGEPADGTVIEMPVEAAPGAPDAASGGEGDAGGG
jgi:thiol-disulfide isomerase/thioredoxin